MAFYSYGNPNLYMLCKEGNGEIAIGLWNFFEDEVINPVIHLDKQYREIQFLNCSGVVQGDCVCLSDIPAYAFAGFVVKK